MNRAATAVSYHISYRCRFPCLLGGWTAIIAGSRVDRLREKGAGRQAGTWCYLLVGDSFLFLEGGPHENFKVGWGYRQVPRASFEGPVAPKARTVAGAAKPFLRPPHQSHRVTDPCAASWRSGERTNERTQNDYFCSAFW